MVPTRVGDLRLAHITPQSHASGLEMSLLGCRWRLGELGYNGSATHPDRLCAQGLITDIILTHSADIHDLLTSIDTIDGRNYFLHGQYPTYCSTVSPSSNLKDNQHD